MRAEADLRKHLVALAGAAGLLALACGEVMPGPTDGGGSGEGMDAGETRADAGRDAGELLADAGLDAGPGMPDFPTWQLVDVQPKSSRFNQTYGLSAFLGRPTVVMLLEGF